MKKTIMLLCLMMAFVSLNAQKINIVVNDAKGKKMLLGEIDKNGFNQKEFDWFNKNTDQYLTNNKVIDKLKPHINDYEIKAFFGTWCGDSKKYVPAFYKVLEEANYNMKNLHVYALDNREGKRKQSPNHEEKGLDIHRVPTFIFYKNGKEVNRIVERPHFTLEDDMLKIFTTKKQGYPYYVVAEHLIKQIKNTDALDSLNTNMDNTASYLLEYVKGSKEINTLAHMFLNTNDVDKAEFLFNLNAKMFPRSPRVYGSLGELFVKKKEYTKALENFYRALSIQPDNKYIHKKIEKIKTTLEQETKKKETKK